MIQMDLSLCKDFNRPLVNKLMHETFLKLKNSSGHFQGHVVFFKLHINIL